MSISWQTVSPEFKPDGSFRDIYVSPTTTKDWQQLLDTVQEHGTDLQYSVDGHVLPIPRLVVDIFAARPDASPLLIFKFNDLYFYAYFFSVDEIELTIAPKDIQAQLELDNLLSFLQHLGDLLLKQVLVTPENCIDEAFIIYEPISCEFRFIPPTFSNYT